MLVQDPVRSFSPVNVATAVVATEIAAWTVAFADPVVELVPLAHARELGIVTFSLAQSATLKERAATQRSDPLSSLQNQEYVLCWSAVSQPARIQHASESS